MGFHSWPCYRHRSDSTANSRQQRDSVGESLGVAWAWPHWDRHPAPPGGVWSGNANVRKTHHPAATYDNELGPAAR